MSEAEKLKKIIKELEEALKREKKEKEKIEKEFEKTRKEFEQYKAKYPATKELPAFVKEDIKTEKKTPGQKKGHKGYSRRIPERIDFIIPLVIDICPDCNGNLSETQEIRERTIIDIPLTSETTNTQYKIHRKYCRKCKKIVEPDVPNALPNSPFGLNLMLFVAFLKIGMALPYNKIQQLLLTMYGLKMSEGGLVNILSQIKEEFGDYYLTLEKKMRKVRTKHSDESGWRIDGINNYVWLFVTKEIALYKIRKSRGSEVPAEVLGRQKGKVITCDGFSAYNKLKTLTHCLIQLCWFHILKNSRKHKKNYPEEATVIHDRLKEIYALAKSYDHKATDKQVEKLKEEIKWLAYPVYKHQEVKGFLNTLLERIDELFRFTQDGKIAGDNNIAERGLRKAVIIRKTSNGSRSHKGAEILEVLLSVVETAKLQKQNPLLFMRQIIASER
jgi:transposase